MNNKNLSFLSVIAAASLVTACGGGGSDGGGSNAICQIIGTGGTASSASPNTTQIDSANNAFDGNLSSAAELYSVVGAGNATFTVSGGLSSARYAGVLVTEPAGQITQIDITTRRGGAVIDSRPAATQTATSGGACNEFCQSRNNQTFYGIEASGPFDQISATFQFSGTTADTLVYELCTSNFELPF